MQDENKIYNLLEKVYIELQNTNKSVINNSNEISYLKDAINDNNTRLTKLDLKFENIIEPNFKILFESQSQILQKLDNHDVEIRVIKGGKKNAK